MPDTTKPVNNRHLHSVPGEGRNPLRTVDGLMRAIIDGRIDDIEREIEIRRVRKARLRLVGDDDALRRD